MRVTFDPIRDGMPAIDNAASDFAEAQWQVSTGKRLRAPSDDPSAARRVINEQAAVSGLDAYTRAADSAASRLTTMDSVLGDIVDKLTQGLTAAASAQGSTATQNARDAAATALLGIRDSISGDINTAFNGSYLFAGSQSTVKPYDNSSGAWTYQGDAVSTTVDIDSGRSVTLAVSGRAILQGSDATDVLTALENLASASKTGDTAGIQTGIDALQRAFNRAVQAQSRVGIDERSVDDTKQRLATQRTAATTRLSADQDADLAEASTKMTRAETAYRAALGAVSSTSQLSLMDYLK